MVVILFIYIKYSAFGTSGMQACSNNIPHWDMVMMGGKTSDIDGTATSVLWIGGLIGFKKHHQIHNIRLLFPAAQRYRFDGCKQL